MSVLNINPRSFLWITIPLASILLVSSIYHSREWIRTRAYDVKVLKTPNPILTTPTPFGSAYAWDIGAIPSVMMDVQNTVNYQLNGSYADRQWAMLIPKEGKVFFGENKHPYMVSMFHQLQCLDIIRRAYIDGAEGGDSAHSSLTRHCLNYIRQMVMCRADSKLERVVDPYGAHAVQVREPQRCSNWKLVYDRMAKMQH